MADEEYISPHDDISAAYNSLLALEQVDASMYGKRLKPRIERNALYIIDKALQELVKQWEPEREDEEED